MKRSTVIESQQQQQISGKTFSDTRHHYYPNSQLESVKGLGYTTSDQASSCTDIDESDTDWSGSLSLSTLVNMTTDIHPSLRPSYAFAPASNSQSSPYPPSTPSSLQSQSRQSYDGRILSGKVRRLTLGVDDAAQQRRQNHDRDEVKSETSPAEQAAPHKLRTRTSATRNTWMKRLSSAMSSRSASPAPSEAISADLSLSTASKTFSHHSSNTPMLGSRPPTAAGPNKLVKRTSSQRILGDASMPSLRRPATSHQRSAALHQYSSSQASPLSTASPDDLIPSNQVRWRQYFSMKVPKFTRSQKRHATHDGTTLQQSISRKHDLVEVAHDQLSPSSSPAHAFGAAASTSSGNQAQNQSVSDSAQTIPTSAIESPTGFFSDTARFSFQGLLNRRSSRKINDQRRSTKLIKQPSRRVVSDSIIPDTKMGVSDGERPAKRRQAINSALTHQTVDAPTKQQEIVSNPIVVSNTFAASPTTFQSGFSSPNTTSATNSPDATQFHFRAGIINSAISRDSNTQPYMRTSTASEPASTLVGSEVEIGRGFILADDEDTDQSTLFDSVRTRGTRSTSGAYRARIETIFDESPSPPSSTPPKLGNILPEGMLGGRDSRRKDQNARTEDESNMATPVRTIRSIRSDKADDGSPLPPRTKSRNPIPLQLSSPPDLQKALNLGTLEYDDDVEDDDDESRWSCFDDDSKLDLDQQMVMLEEQSIGEMDWAASKRTSINSATTSTSRPTEDRDSRRGTKNNIFDWSEQPADKILSDNSPPRPRTVHGNKKGAADRGARTSGRRMPSGLHARSQSVPVVPGLAGTRETVMTNKFGTWGVGSKGVSEDWDEDFDFGDERLHSSLGHNDKEDGRVDSALLMHIPQTIRESQANVVTNIGLVREFYKLIEELKVLRLHASQDLESLRQAHLVWNEIDAMIDLADQEVDDPLFPAQPSLPTSPAHEPDPFEDGIDTSRRPSIPQISADPRRSRSQRRSVIPTVDNDVFSSPLAPTQPMLVDSPILPATALLTRPRKDSEAMARSVIEAVQRKREPVETDVPLQPASANKKVPFDTNTLRHIVPYVNNLVRKARASIPRPVTNDDGAGTLEQPRLTQLFNQPQNVSPLQQRSKRPEVKSGIPHKGKENEAEKISKQLYAMNLE